jgi:hypothetical protein
LFGEIWGLFSLCFAFGVVGLVCGFVVEFG